MATSLLN
jgi:hypothetical protein